MFNKLSPLYESIQAFHWDTDKSCNFEHYENDTELSKESWIIKSNHFTPKVTRRIIRKWTPFNTTKKNIIGVSMKSLKSLHRKGKIYWIKSQNLLTSLDTKTNSFLYGMIARTKSYVFIEIFLAVFLLEHPFWTAQLMFSIYGFQNNNWAGQNDGFIGEYLGKYFLWRRHGNDVTFSFGYYYTVIFSL